MAQFGVEAGQFSTSVLSAQTRSKTGLSHQYEEAGGTHCLCVCKLHTYKMIKVFAVFLPIPKLT